MSNCLMLIMGATLRLMNQSTSINAYGLLGAVTLCEVSSKLWFSGYPKPEGAVSTRFKSTTHSKPRQHHGGVTAPIAQERWEKMQGTVAQSAHHHPRIAQAHMKHEKWL